MKVMTSLIASIALLLFANESIAHAKLIQSTPEHQSVLSESPAELSLKFNRDVKLVKVELKAAGEVIKIDFTPLLTAKETYSIPLATELQEGNYEIHWVGMGKDGHKMKGVIEFQINKSNE
jgi:hypothetical protein